MRDKEGGRDLTNMEKRHEHERRPMDNDKNIRRRGTTKCEGKSARVLMATTNHR